MHYIQCYEEPNYTGYKELFVEACITGNLQEAKTILQKNQDIKFSDFETIAFAFIEACNSGNLRIGEFLLLEDVNKSIDKNIVEYAFDNACQNGNLTVAQWLYYLTGKFNSNINYLFKCACEHGSLEIAKWLYLINADIDPLLIEKNAFTLACDGGHINVAKWLISIHPNINITILDDRTFFEAYNNDFLEITQFLCNLRPFRYALYLESDDYYYKNIDCYEKTLSFLYVLTQKGYKNALTPALVLLVANT